MTNDASYTVLVCGSRFYRDGLHIYAQLDALSALLGPLRIVHGTAGGADTLASDWARFRRRPEQRYPAHWHTYGRAAGPIRNAFMLKDAKPDLVFAFPGGRGTHDMVKRAQTAGTPVCLITP